ncbi:MAG TPA: tetratricopeptide repeat protein [Myxococcota bacterium]
MRSLALLVVIAVTTAAAAACNTTDAGRLRAQADGHREVALAIVAEADKASVSGDRTLQDAKYREALAELLQGEKTGAMDSDGNYLIGLVYFLGFGRHEEAIAHLQKAIEQKQKEAQAEYPEAENLLGAVLVDAGRPADAIPHFDKARTNLLYATPYFAEQGMGEALFKLGRHDEAAAHLQAALIAYPDLCGAYVKLAEIAIVKGDDAKVQEVLGTFLTRCDSDRLRANTGARLIAPALLELGKSRLRTGQRDPALEAFKQCATRFPEEPAAKDCDSQMRALADAG